MRKNGEKEADVLLGSSAVIKCSNGKLRLWGEKNKKQERTHKNEKRKIGIVYSTFHFSSFLEMRMILWSLCSM